MFRYSSSNIVSPDSSSTHICEMTWHVAKTTNRRSKDLVKERNCKQSVLWSSSVVFCRPVSECLYFCLFSSNTPHTLPAGLELLDVYSTCGIESKSKWQFKWDSPNEWHEFQWLQPFIALALGILHHIKFTLTLLNWSGKYLR